MGGPSGHDANSSTKPPASSRTNDVFVSVAGMISTIIFSLIIGVGQLAVGLSP